jgi:hypothetical protein
MSTGERVLPASVDDGTGTSFPFGSVSSLSVVTGAVLRVGRSTLRLKTASVLNRPW